MLCELVSLLGAEDVNCYAFECERKKKTLESIALCGQGIGNLILSLSLSLSLSLVLSLSLFKWFSGRYVDIYFFFFFIAV